MIIIYDYSVSDFINKESSMNYIEMFKGRSIKDFGIDFGKGDKIITLTSYYITSANRLVVHAKLVTNN